MFSDLALKAGVGLNDKANASGTQAFGEELPVPLCQDNSKMWNRNIMPIDRIAMQRRILCGGAGFVMSDDLVAEEVKVDPVLCAPALRQTQYRAVEVPGSFEIIDREGNVKRTQRGHGLIVAKRQQQERFTPAHFLSGIDANVQMQEAFAEWDQLSWDGPALCPDDEMGVERATQHGFRGERGEGERVTEIILADNQAVFRAGAARVLAHENDLRVVGECTEVQRLRELVEAFARPIAIFPSSLTPDLEDLLRFIRTQGGRAVIILEHGVTLPERLARQANGFISRSVTGPQLLDTLRRVAMGQNVPQRSGIKEMPLPDHAGTQVVQRLTPKELQIVALVSEGAKNREIGVRLGTKEQVVKNYLRSIYDKVGVSDRLELALYTVHHRTLNEAVERVRATLARSA